MSSTFNNIALVFIIFVFSMNVQCVEVDYKVKTVLNILFSHLNMLFRETLFVKHVLSLFTYLQVGQIQNLL